MIKNILNLLKNQFHLTFLNTVLILLILLANFYYQAFCIPVNWAKIVITICFTCTIFNSYLLKSKFSWLFSFVNGVSVFVFVYCIIFLYFQDIGSLILVIIFGCFIVFIPCFLLFQIVGLQTKNASKLNNSCFIGGLILCAFIVLFIGYKYNKAEEEFKHFKNSNYQKLEQTYLNEKILGMHFIYHTRICFYDGWRSPKHDPVLIIGMWLTT